jgi:hypothetical protein
MDESSDHEPTLIERGMGVHLNHPIAARRGISNPRLDQWGLWKPHPPPREWTARARLKQDGELTLIASNGPRFGGSTHGYTSWGAPNTRRTSHARVTEADWNVADAG